METLSKNAELNFERFIVEALANGCVWGLEGPKGWALCPSEKYTDTDVMPFWSQSEYAELQCAGDWAEYQPVAVALEEFLDDWLTGLHKDVLLVGVNWNDELEGLELEPLDLLADIEAEMN